MYFGNNKKEEYLCSVDGIIHMDPVIKEQFLNTCPRAVTYLMAKEPVI